MASTCQFRKLVQNYPNTCSKKVPKFWTPLITRNHWSLTYENKTPKPYCCFVLYCFTGFPTAGSDPTQQPTGGQNSAITDPAWFFFHSTAIMNEVSKSVTWSVTHLQIQQIENVLHFTWHYLHMTIHPPHLGKNICDCHNSFKLISHGTVHYGQPGKISHHTFTYRFYNKNTAQKGRNLKQVICTWNAKGECIMGR